MLRNARWLNLILVGRRQGRSPETQSFIWLAFAGSIAVLAFLAVLWFLRTSPPYAVIEVKTTYLRQLVDRPIGTQMRLHGVEYVNSLGSCKDRLKSLDPTDFIELWPSKGADLVYRWRSEGVSIRVQAPNSGQSGGQIIYSQQSCDLGERTTLRLKTPRQGRSLILPVAGPASAGSEVAGTSQGSGHLYGGEITLYGRALLPPFSGSLYPAVSSPLVLAEGGRITSALKLSEGDSWYGTARATANGLSVSVTSETKTLKIVRPGSNREVEPLAIGLLAQLFSDPSVAPWTIGMFFVTSVVHLIAAMSSVAPSPRTVEPFSEQTANSALETSTGENPDTSSDAQFDVSAIETELENQKQKTNDA